ncbi:hypothetical protein [Bradyrhizobium sp. DASA03120]|uniref:hypothetical protein n=1 Tax=Bradyrhizobium sp. SMVTL-02 TaxID=3395917 RepID=UPI003F72677D
MSNRGQRRRDLAEFRKASHLSLLTYLVAAHTPLDDHPLLRNALAFWRGNIRQRRPFCPACRASFADDAEPGAFLFAVPAVAPTSVTVSGFCTQCWSDLPPDVIECEAVRVLRRLIPSGGFIDG